MFILGPARLDAEKQLITDGARTAVLPRKPYFVLLYLIENRQRMVSRKELLDRFWEGKEVYDQSLNKAIGSIRKALDDVGGEDFIETRWGLGYRYVGPFMELAAPPNGSPVHSQQPESAETAKESRSADAAAKIVEASGIDEWDQKSPRPLPRIPRSFRPSKSMMLGAVGSVIILAAFAVLLFHRGNNGAIDLTRGAESPSVAVLPFTATAEDVEGQYLGLELADLVTARLAMLPELSVRSSSTVRSIVGLDANPAEASKKLDVQVLVTGRIQSSGSQRLAFVQLVSSSDGAKLWSGNFPADMANLSQAQASIAAQLTKILAPHSAGKAPQPSSRLGTSNPAAYSEYMQAKFFSTTRTRTSLEKAIALLLDATRIDPSFARAYAALADYYALEGFYGFTPADAAYPKGKEAALKALALDNSLVEAHVSLLSILTDYDWDWQGAEREFRAAIAIDPNDAVAYQYYGYALEGMKRGDEALAAMQRAARIDPVSPSIQTSLAWGYYLARQNQAAVNQCKRVLALYPDFVPAHQLMGIAYGQMNDADRAMAELKKAEELETDDSITPVLIDYELARMGQQTAAARNLSRILAGRDTTSLPLYYVAAAWTAIGNREEAEAFLDHAFYLRSNWVIFLNYDARFDSLRGDSGFRSLLDRLTTSETPTNSARR